MDLDDSPKSSWESGTSLASAAPSLQGFHCSAVTQSKMNAWRAEITCYEPDANR